MNDRFRYRVWDKTKNKWLYFDFSTYPTYQDRIWQALTDGETFYQCTGSKDKNGKLIYEGDILGGTFGNLYVHYCDNCKQFQLKANDYGCMACEGDIHWYEVVEDNNELEVVGNIYENPELLESEG